VALTRSQIVQSDEAVMRAREALGVALGSDDAWGVVPNVPIEELASTARAVCTPVPTADDRADVHAARMQYEVANRVTEGVDYRFAPTLDLTSNLNYVNNANRSANGEHVTWTVGALLTWPIYDGGDRWGDRRRAEAEALIAQEQLTEIKRGAKLEVKQAHRAVQVATANRTVSRE
jgi:outer membrane protein TolC